MDGVDFHVSQKTLDNSGVFVGDIRGALGGGVLSFEELQELQGDDRRYDVR